MKKRLQILLSILFLLGCRNNNSKLEQRIYIGYVSTDYKEFEKEKIDLVNKQFFSKGFWDYFIKKFPHSTATIFYYHIIGLNSSIKLQDTSFIVQTGDYGTFAKMYDNLPKIVEGKEKVSEFLPQAFFEFDNSDSRKVKDTIVVPPLTDLIRSDYLRFLDAIKDRRNSPIFVFKRDFLTQIEAIYR